MAWNEPGGSGNKDPWGNRPDKEQGPPDLDEILKNFQDKLNSLLGGKGRGGGDEPPADGGAGGGGRRGGSMAFGGLAAVLLVVWALSGIYIVDPAERGVVTRFGKYVETTTPGPHWHLPYPIESVEIIDVDQIRNVEIGYRSTTAAREISSVPQEALMLTQDENIVDIKFAVQYQVKNAKDYLFNVRDPDSTLRQATESAVREAIGKSKMDFVLTQGQSEIADRTEALLQEILDGYESGLLVTSVNVQSAQPPKEVQGAFEDAIKAREDQQRLINDAEAYANDIIPKARGNAARQLEEANGYKARVIAQAEGESSRFSQLLAEYQKAPEVTRQRLYLDAVESILANTSKVMVDVEGGNNLLYLPLDRILSQPGQSTTMPMMPQFNPQAATLQPEQPRRRERENQRSRMGR